MANFVLIALCISAGIILSKLNILPKDSHKSINAWVLYVALPALSFRYIPEIVWSWKMLLQIIGPVVVWCGSWLFVDLFSRMVKISQATRTAMIVTGGLGNTAFLGYPMISAFYGEGEIQNAILFDQVTFLLFSTVAVITILLSSSENSEKLSFKSIIGKVFRFPPFLGCLGALILSSVTDISPINPFLDKLVATVSPMALFSIGLQLKIGDWKAEMTNLTAGLFYKLMIAPALVLVLAIGLHATGTMAQLSVFEAGMSSHITASLLCGQYNRNPNLCNLMVGFGIVICFITITFWKFILDFFLPL